MKNKVIKISAVLFTIIIVFVLFSQIQLDDLIRTLISIGPWFFLSGLILYMLSYFFRTLRFHILLNREIELKNLFNIVCVHNMMNNILPARTGELSYIYLLKKHHDIKVGEGIATLLGARLFDFIVVSMFFFASALTSEDLFVSNRTELVWIIILFFILNVVFLIVLLYFGIPFLNLVSMFFGRIGWQKKQSVDLILRKGFEAVKSFEKIKSRSVSFWVFLSSILNIGLNYLLIYIILYGMNIHLPFQKVVIGATIIMATSLLPIYGIGGFGTTEGVWTLVFVPLGLSLQTAIISGFSYHIITWFYFLIAGGYGFICLNGSSKR